MDLVAAIFFVTSIWILIGMCVIDVWKDMFDDIPNRHFRVGSRLAMLTLWPVWLVFWAVCAVIAIICMMVGTLLE